MRDTAESMKTRARYWTKKRNISKSGQHKDKWRI